jgi:hypothetical protein
VSCFFGKYLALRESYRFLLSLPFEYSTSSSDWE